MTSTPTRPVDSVVIATKGLQDRSTNITAGTTVENKGKLIIKICLNGTQSNVRIGNYLSSSFPIENGLKQGDAL